jgi:DNA modification methylase
VHGLHGHAPARRALEAPRKAGALVSLRADVLRGDCRVVLAALPAASVHCVVTSPPYWGLRNYGFAEQIGLEATPKEYVDTLVDVFRAVRRVLREDGTVWVNLGDAFHDKQLVGIPWRVAFALQADGWYLRADIIWAKPNPMPESVRDRPTKAHDYVFLLTKSARYFYDAEAVRERTGHETSWEEYGRLTAPGATWPSGGLTKGAGAYKQNHCTHPAGRNLRSVWTIATQAYAGAHFATFPEALVVPCVKAGTSERGCCAQCGAPWERVVERVIPLDPGRGASKLRDANGLSARAASTAQRQLGQAYQNQLNEHPPKTTGWCPTCACAAEVVPCTVLDPFAGSGTVVLVANRLGRHGIGIEANPAYGALSTQRNVQLVLL